MPPCPRCAGTVVKSDGRGAGDMQRYRCGTCRRTFVARTGTPFAGHRWPQEVIVTAVRWYCAFRLSAAQVRDLVLAVYSVRPVFLAVLGCECQNLVPHGISAYYRLVQPARYSRREPSSMKNST